ncbi:dipeptide epimerase [Tianweitania sp. BSSL-BM11]|uniref:Dipeptide epimerase n=1 Tax=Tianweitania aestuarii TaxID=2814886 RepID=A0ABS5RUK5_9HYPH|nr:N-acetyl-D-Glu racemase DgcA [Tianweitania aestuarii]MBS9720729.1 dipeptide epimerase [Tianweitania aestuarii]
MPRHLLIEEERFPIAGAFTIARGSKTQAEVITCTLIEDSVQGRGECVPYRRYGETLESVRLQIETARSAIENGISRQELLGAMQAGAARNAVDCALWDLQAKQSGRSVSDLADLNPPQPLETAFTISLGEPEKMATDARDNAWRPLLKVKVGTEDDRSRMAAVAETAPNSRIILDANEGWTSSNIEMHLAEAARLGIALIEQPLPAGSDDMLGRIARPVPVCADESVHGVHDLAELRGRYDAINIKLDKTGGLTAALDLRKSAEALGFQIMVGCMVGTSLSMAPAILLAQGAAFVDLDGPLLLAKDREPGLTYTGSIVSPPVSTLWG